MKNRAEQASPAEPVDPHAVARHFVSLVDRMPQVREVLLADAQCCPRIWTVIEAPPLDYQATSPVYDAELACFSTFPDMPVSFRVINRVEFDDWSPNLYLPSDALVLLRR